MRDNLRVMYHNEKIRRAAPLQPKKGGDCGLDLANASEDDIIVGPRESVEVPAGVSIKLPERDGERFAGIIKARSSTFWRRGLMVVEGVIDPGYVGALFVQVYNPALNAKDKPEVIRPWERLAQLIVFRSPRFEVTEVSSLPNTERGESGFGSTGE